MTTPEAKGVSDDRMCFEGRLSARVAQSTAYVNHLVPRREIAGGNMIVLQVKKRETEPQDT